MLNLGRQLKVNWNITVAPARATCIDAVAACNCASHLNLLRCYCILSTLKWDNIYFANYFHWNNYVGLFMKPIHQLSMVYWSLLFTCCHGYGYGRNLLKQLHSVACSIPNIWRKASHVPGRRRIIFLKDESFEKQHRSWLSEWCGEKPVLP